jgi:hypothetical protein
MNLRHTFFACAFGLAALHANGGLVISEVLYNEVGSDVDGEWIEIFNNSLTAIDLTNFKIGDEETSGGTGTGESVLQFPSGASIGPGQVQIVAVNATRFFAVYSFLPTYELDSSDAGVPDMLAYATWDPDGGVFNLSNSNDQALILDGSNVVVDALNWGNTFYFNPGLNPTVADGQSYERSNPLTDSDTAGDWVLGSPSSPGVIPEPTSMTLGLAGAFFLGITRRRRP